MPNRNPLNKVTTNLTVKDVSLYKITKLVRQTNFTK